jgi:hypothetical protein
VRVVQINKKYFKLYAKKENKLFLFWIRVPEIGVSIKNTPVTFSERYGFVKYWQVFDLKIQLLKKVNLLTTHNIR